MKPVHGLLACLSLSLLVTLLACGSGAGSVATSDLKGHWQGSYIAYDGSQHGTFCAVLHEDDPGISGEIRFNGGEPVEFGGVITGGRFLMTWGPVLKGAPAHSMSADITSGGGTLNGTAQDGAMSGRWVSVAKADVYGDWTGSRLPPDKGCD